MAPSTCTCKTELSTGLISCQDKLYGHLSGMGRFKVGQLNHVGGLCQHGNYWISVSNCPHMIISIGGATILGSHKGFQDDNYANHGHGPL